MFFHVRAKNTIYSSIPGTVTLHQDMWDDFGFKTLFSISYCEPSGEIHDLGSVHIGYKGMKTGKVIDAMSSEFDELPSNFFSLGSYEEYYDKLNRLDDKVRKNILKRLNDLAYNLELFNEVVDEEVVYTSLLRSTSSFSVQSQLHRMAHGGAKLTEYKFKYNLPCVDKENECTPAEIDFNILPDSTPPTNVHVLIGRNGIGKTFLLKNMIKALLTNEEKYGVIEFASDRYERYGDFANILCVAYSPFDDFSDVIECSNKSSMSFKYIGLNKQCNNLLNDINEQFIYYFKNTIINKGKTIRWKKAIGILGDDPAFLESQVLSFPDIWDLDYSIEKATAKREISEVFSRLSSGHKVVLLIITACVDKLEEKSILFLDEPENHLHPPLLASFIRALTFLLINRNGVGIISTHSPVILQEVPRSCVWNFRRSESIIKPERLQIETFGSSISLLTTEVFGLEITNSGFHKMIKDILQSHDDEAITYKSIEELFNKQLGNEAQALIRTMISNGAE